MITKGTIYVNDSITDIQTGINQADSGKVIMVSMGSFGGDTVTISGKSNVAIIGPDRGQGTICELSGGRGLTLGSTSTGITIANLQIEGLLTLAGSGNNYFTNLDCLGGITISSGATGNYFFKNCGITGSIIVPNTFLGVIAFNQCNFAGATFSLNNQSPLQVQIVLALNLPLARPTNATYGLANSDTNLHITTDTRYLRVNNSVGVSGQILYSGGSGNSTYWGNDLTTSLSTEISTRGSADTSLSTALSTEISTRGSDVLSLSTGLSAETSDRGSADTSLSTALSTETSTRGSADTSLSTGLSTEISARTSADTSITNLFTSTLSLSNVVVQGNTTMGTTSADTIIPNGSLTKPFTIGTYTTESYSTSSLSVFNYLGGTFESSFVDVSGGSASLNDGTSHILRYPFTSSPFDASGITLPKGTYMFWYSVRTDEIAAYSITKLLMGLTTSNVLTTLSSESTIAASLPNISCYYHRTDAIGATAITTPYENNFLTTSGCFRLSSSTKLYPFFGWKLTNPPVDYLYLNLVITRIG